jgi:citrate lyase subunit beta / citryl-CoA lyase
MWRSGLCAWRWSVWLRERMACRCKWVCTQKSEEWRVQVLSARGVRWAAAGNYGPEIRSDCRVTVWEEGSTERPPVQLSSKVAVLYGDAILRQAAATLAALDASDLAIRIEDSGALPFALAARIEAAVRRLRPHTVKTVLPDLNPAREARARGGGNQQRLRRTRLYLPGVTPKLFINAGLYGADAVILDLEDSVAAGEKDAARLLVRNALRAVDFYGAERMVRVNQLPAGLDDMRMLAYHGVDTYVVPKVEQAAEVVEAAGLLDEVQQESGVDVALVPIIESAAGVINAVDIARASRRVVALAIGLEDYITDIGAVRTAAGRESEWACSQVLNAARAAGVQPLASVYADVADTVGLRQWVQEMRMCGFEGAGCLHPSQIAVVHQVYTPTMEEVDEAETIIAAYMQAVARGSGATAVAGRMVDLPVVKRAQRTLALARGGERSAAGVQGEQPI